MARWRRGGGQRWIDSVHGLSEQCVLRCDQTRSMEYRLETSGVTERAPVNKCYDVTRFGRRDECLRCDTIRQK